MHPSAEAIVAEFRAPAKFPRHDNVCANKIGEETCHVLSWRDGEKIALTSVGVYAKMRAPANCRNELIFRSIDLYSLSCPFHVLIFVLERHTL